MALTVSNLQFGSMGDNKLILCSVAFDTSYPTGGEVITAAQLGCTLIKDIIVNQTAGYSIQFVPGATAVTAKLKCFDIGAGTPAGTISLVSAGTPTGTNAASAVAGTADAQVFTGTASALNIAAPTFSGVGYATAGQVTTTTDNKTMTLNQCAGMWLIGNTAAEPPALIVSNTAVVAAPAVLTCIGVPPATDAGAYKIVSVIPTGTNGSSALSASTAAAQIFTGDLMATHNHVFAGTPVAAGAAAEVPNGTNLSVALASVVLAVVCV